MKTSRKGFTLVELLIVVAILATLTASMTMAVSGSTGKAKAAVIASNVEAIKSTVSNYLKTNTGTAMSTATPDSVLYDALPSWKSFSTTGNITYTATGTAGDVSDWIVAISFTNDADKEEIREALIARPGYEKYYKSATDAGAEVMPANTYTFKLWLDNGQVTATTETRS